MAQVQVTALLGVSNGADHFFEDLRGFEISRGRNHVCTLTAIAADFDRTCLNDRLHWARLLAPILLHYRPVHQLRVLHRHFPLLHLHSLDRVVLRTLCNRLRLAWVSTSISLDLRLNHLPSVRRNCSN